MGSVMVAIALMCQVHTGAASNMVEKYNSDQKDCVRAYVSCVHKEMSGRGIITEYAYVQAYEQCVATVK